MLSHKSELWTTCNMSAESMQNWCGMMWCLTNGTFDTYRWKRSYLVAGTLHRDRENLQVQRKVVESWVRNADCTVISRIGQVVRADGEKHLAVDNNGASWAACSEICPPDKWGLCVKIAQKRSQRGRERFHTNERSVSGKLQGGRIAQMPSIPFTWRSLVTEVTPIAQMQDKLGNFFQS